MFATLRARSREALVVGDTENLDQFSGGALRFGLAGPEVPRHRIDYFSLVHQNPPEATCLRPANES